jgi:hypothetical protein
VLVFLVAMLPFLFYLMFIWFTWYFKHLVKCVLPPILGHCKRTFNAYLLLHCIWEVLLFLFFPFQIDFRYRKMHKLICFGGVGCVVPILPSIYFDPTHRSGMFKFSNGRCFCWQFLWFRSDHTVRATALPHLPQDLVEFSSLLLYSLR